MLEDAVCVVRWWANLPSHLEGLGYGALSRFLTPSLTSRKPELFKIGWKHLEVTEDVFLAPQSKERSQTLLLPFLESQECSLDFFHNEGLCICVSGKLLIFLPIIPILFVMTTVLIHHISLWNLWFFRMMQCDTRGWYWLNLRQLQKEF